MEKPQDERPERQYRILGRSSQRDAARFIEVAYRNWDVADAKAEMHALQEELRIEHEVVTVGFKRDGLEHFAVIRAKSTVLFSKILPGESVLDDRETAIREILRPGHLTGERLATSPNAIAKNDVAHSDAQDVESRRNDSRIVVIVRVEHDDELGSSRQCFPVAGLLIAPVTQVSLVTDQGHG